MANKVAAVLIMCFVLVAAVQMHQTEADGGLDVYAACFNTCHQECQDEGNGSTFCEMKCDADCVAKETAAKFNIQP